MSKIQEVIQKNQEEYKGGYHSTENDRHIELLKALDVLADTIVRLWLGRR